MSNFVSVILCRNCGSRHIEIRDWTDDGKAVILCRGCGNKEEVGGFTLGRCSVTGPEMMNARDTAAKKGRYER